MDRIDIHVEVPALKVSEITSSSFAAESSAKIKERVIKAREIQTKRFAHSKIHSNSQMSVKDMAKYCALENDTKNILKDAMEKLKLSARAYDRILKVARTIADIDGSENIKTVHIAEAVRYRVFDRQQ